MKQLKNDDIKALRGVGHQLDPVVIVGGNGITDAVIAEIVRALDDHELIKIKIPAGDSQARLMLANDIAEQTNSQIIHRIGRMVLLLKKMTNPMSNCPIWCVLVYD